MSFFLACLNRPAFAAKLEVFDVMLQHIWATYHPLRKEQKKPMERPCLLQVLSTSSTVSSLVTALGGNSVNSTVPLTNVDTDNRGYGDVAANKLARFALGYMYPHIFLITEPERDSMMEHQKTMANNL